MLGIIGGTSFLGLAALTSGEKLHLETPYGVCSLYKRGDLVFIPRHGDDNNIPPHSINHQANFHAMSKLGVKRIVSFGSVGGLSDKFGPGSLVIPDDWFAPFRTLTMFDHKINLTVPSFNKDWRKRVVDHLNGADVLLLDHGTYVETLGPRFETTAEVRWLATVGDIVGMTCAAEATLACELTIPHAVVAMVDNYANGLGLDALSGERFRAKVIENRERVLWAFERVLELQI